MTGAERGADAQHGPQAHGAYTQHEMKWRCNPSRLQRYSVEAPGIEPGARVTIFAVYVARDAGSCSMDTMGQADRFGVGGPASPAPDTIAAKLTVRPAVVRQVLGKSAERRPPRKRDEHAFVRHDSGDCRGGTSRCRRAWNSLPFEGAVLAHGRPSAPDRRRHTECGEARLRRNGSRRECGVRALVDVVDARRNGSCLRATFPSVGERAHRPCIGRRGSSLPHVCALAPADTARPSAELTPSLAARTSARFRSGQGRNVRREFHQSRIRRAARRGSAA
jgi:hypothetical protein